MTLKSGHPQPLIINIDIPDYVVNKYPQTLTMSKNM